MYKVAATLKLGRLIPPALLKMAAITKHNLTMPGAQNILPHPLFHLHGTRDEVFPLHCTTPTHIIPKGGHMFLMSRAETVNQILGDILSLPQKRTPA